MDHAVTGRRRTGLLSRLRFGFKAMLAPPPPEPDELLAPTGRPTPPRHQDALAVLVAARGVVQRGWGQNTWYVLQSPGGRRRDFAPTCLTRLDHAQVVQACLVGAVVHAAWQQSPHAEHAHPAIDALWLALHRNGGLPGTEPVGPVSAPPLRAARVRDLTRWNDQQGRTKEDILQLLDRAALRIAAAGA